MKTKLNDYRDRAYCIAVAHGWHDEDLSDEHWKCLIISELMEAVEADRRGKRADIKGATECLLAKNDSPTQCKIVESDQSLNCIFEMELVHPYKVFEQYIKDTVEDELADACIRIFDLAGLRNINLWVDDLYGKAVAEDKSFTENIYTICQKVLLYNNSLRICLNNTLKQIFRLAQILNIDLYKHIELKMEYNKHRKYKHGKQY